ncbi:c-type cytochrome [Ottowia testudinis]|uniref:c-type cytochrome n=1 Tax=Ottowia testudinis TaxID=2816950 RepID=UPI0032678D74
MTLLSLLLIATLLLWQRQRPVDRAAPLLRPGDDTLVIRGAAIYSRHCASCHGASGEGQPNWRQRGPDGLLPAPPHDSSGHTWHHPDAQLFAITKLGLPRVINQPNYQTAMPVYEGVLSDDDIIAVLSWIKAQWPPEVRAHQDQINAQAAPATR